VRTGIATLVQQSDHTVPFALWHFRDKPDYRFVA